MPAPDDLSSRFVSRHTGKEQGVTDPAEPTGPSATNISLPPAPMQLRDVFPVTLVARRYQVAPAPDQPHGQANAQVSNLTIFSGEPFTQVQLTATIVSAHEPSFFDIEVTIVGVFERTGALPVGYTLESYLEATSLALLMPFLRENVFEMGIRMRIGPVLLPTVIPILAPTPEQPSSSTPDPSALGRPIHSADGDTPKSRRRPPRQSPITS